MSKLARALQLLLWGVFALNIAAFFMLPAVMGRHFGMGSGEFWLALAVYYPCGIASAIMIRLGERVLSNVADGQPFHSGNARAIRRAARCCFAISLFALVRTITWLFWYGAGLWLIQRYNTFFVAVFFVAGLFAMVLSELFRTASELKADNDLVI